MDLGGGRAMTPTCFVDATGNSSLPLPLVPTFHASQWRIWDSRNTFDFTIACSDPGDSRRMATALQQAASDVGGCNNADALCNKNPALRIRWMLALRTGVWTCSQADVFPDGNYAYTESEATWLAAGALKDSAGYRSSTQGECLRQTVAHEAWHKVVADSYVFELNGEWDHLGALPWMTIAQQYLRFDDDGGFAPGTTEEGATQLVTRGQFGCVGCN